VPWWQPGCLEERDGLELVALRGRLMHEAGTRAGDGGMLALLGPGAADRAEELAAAHGLTVANDNCPTQVVLSGAREALPAAGESAREAGLRPMEVAVSGAFHSPMMALAVPRFEAAVAEVEFRPAGVTVFSAVHRPAVRGRGRHPPAPGRGPDPARPLARDAARAPAVWCRAVRRGRAGTRAHQPGPSAR